MKSLVWFRSDFRIHDNPALKEACINFDEVHAVYLYSPKQLKEHNEANVKTEFLINNLHSLAQDLEKLNIPLTILKSDGFKNDPQLIQEIITQRNIQKVFWNNQIGTDELDRDMLMKEILDKEKVSYESYFDQLVC